MSNNNISPPPAAATFTVFPKLPTELRLKIWKHALSGRRVVKIARYETEGGLQVFQMRGMNRSGATDPNTLSIIKAVFPPITLLSVNCEARDVVLSNYETPFKGIPGALPIHFDFDRDILFIQDMGTLETFFRALSQNTEASSGGGPHAQRKLQHLMLLGQWTVVLRFAKFLVDLETLTLEPKFPNTAIVEGTVTDYLRNLAKATNGKDFQVGFMSAEEMNRLVAVTNLRHSLGVESTACY